MFKLSSRSLKRLEGVHPDLVKVVQHAITISKIDFTVLEGVRTLATQRKYYSAGKTRTMNSRHLTGHAVDLAPVVDGEVSWDWKHFYPLADAMKAAAFTKNVPITWGGDWESFKDGPHWELPWNKYPK